MLHLPFTGSSERPAAAVQVGDAIDWIDWLPLLNYGSRGTAFRPEPTLAQAVRLAAVDRADKAVGRPDERDGWQSFELLGEPTKRRPVNA